MKRHLTEHLAELACPPLTEAIAPGEGFEIIVAGARVRWNHTAPPRRQGRAWLWRLEQVGGPLRAQVSLLPVPRHRAASYHVELTNAGHGPLTIEGIYPLLVRFPKIAGPWRTLTAGGGSSENFYPPRAYRTRERVVFGGQVRIESAADGRSSNQHLPILLATAGAHPEAPGIFCGMEYSGEWFLALRHVGNAPFLRGLVKIRDVVLAGGETLRLPPVHVGFFGGGLEAGTNALRRYLRDCVCPAPPAPASWPPVCYQHWFGIRNDFDEALLRRQVRRAARLGAEYWVHGPGWFEGGFPRGVGNWHRADPGKYPRGLRPLADAVRSAGMKFGLWFEIERAEAGTWALQRHGQLFLPPPDPSADGSHHLDLARPDAQDWAVQTISRWVAELDLEWVRLDYRLEPAGYFRAAGTTGKVQLAYYAGLYRVLEALRSEHPRLVIENCAGGGRRIDLGTLARTHAAWASDQTFSPDISRYMLWRLGRFLPSGVATSAVCVRRGVPADDLDGRDALARMGGALGFAGDVASLPAATARRMRKWTDAFKRIRHLLDGDFFQLLPTPTSDRDLDAVQFLSPDGSEGVVFASRLAGGTERLRLLLRRIDPQAAYAVSNLARPARTRTVGGDELARAGLVVRLKPDSAVCMRFLRQGRP